MASGGASVDRYSGVAIALHWAIAALILFNLSLGFFMEGFPPPLKNVIVPLHISSGLSVLLLTLARILWRLTHAPPAFPQTMASWQRIAAHGAHTLLYFMMLAMPLSGWAIISAHPPRPGAGPLFWGWFHIPPLGPIAHLAEAPQKAAHGTFVEIHSVAGWIFLALVCLHIAAALQHQFLDRHPELERMGLKFPR